MATGRPDWRELFRKGASRGARDVGGDLSHPPTAETVGDVPTEIDTLTDALQDHIDDPTYAHDASAISVADAGGYYTGTNTETVLQEIGPQLGGGGVPTGHYEPLTTGASPGVLIFDSNYDVVMGWVED